MAAAYAAVVPVVEVFSGILADRWSRRGVLVLSSVALSVCTLAGGLSTGVTSYIASVLALGVYFALFSGTVDAVVYDTVLEETGGSGEFERRVGRVRSLEAVALVTSSLAGGWVAELSSPRVTYFLSVPFALLSIVAYLRFAEPVLHRRSERGTLRAHLGTTWRAMAGGGRLVPVVLAAMLSATVTQLVFEFGPLWLVAVALPAVLYGPYWAVLESMLGLGGLLAGRFALHRLPVLAGLLALLAGACAVLVTGGGAVWFTVAQVVLVLATAVVTIHVLRLLHDAVPSTVRTGVASGVSALSWLVFLPVALLSGVLVRDAGPRAAGWLLAGCVAALAVLLVVLKPRTRLPEVQLVTRT
ncbi:MFS transporter [Amycolatopsis suaedae]